MTLLSRRRFMGASALSLAALPLVGMGRAMGEDGTPARSPLGIADDLFNPPELHSVDGRLSAHLAMGITHVQLPSGPAMLRIFNDSLPGPTLRISPGDTLEVAFENRMPENDDRSQMIVNMPNRFNTTNMHFHGFHVSPNGNSDNVYLQIEPGQKFNYVVQLPQDHPAGNYWYHPHRHGSVSAQVASGAAGMAVISGALDTVPEIAEAVERIMVIQAPVPGVEGLLIDEVPLWEPAGERDFLINGQYRPRIYMREGEVQHWRILHAGDQQFLPLRAEGLTMHIVGRDGNPFKQAELTDELYIAPGNRLNLLMTAGKPGVYQWSRPAFVQGKASLPQFDLAEIVVLAKDDPRVADGTPFGRSVPKGPLPSNAILTDIADEEVTNERKFVLGVTTVEGFFKNTVFTINAQPFDPRRDDVVAKLGAVEEWTLVNTSPYPHPLHIHVNPFQLMEVNGVAVPERIWLDTVPVPAAGSVKFRTRFTDFTGRYVMHCHILPHEDMGMMINVNIEA